jgi:GT2 family glycosyltransferase
VENISDKSAASKRGKNLVVLGMHRSGTSMVSGALVRSGFHAGIENELMSAAEDNPRGFWERHDAVALNDKLLAEANASWFQPVPVAKQELPEIKQLLEGLSFRIPWMLKDPRLIFTWPAWASALKTAAKLYVYRSPLAVATSLSQRNGFPLEHGLDLWEIYNRQGMKIMQAEGGALIHYEAFSQAPESAWEELQKRLGAVGVSINLAETGIDYDRQLDHSQVAHEDEGRLTPEQKRLHKVFLQACETGQIPKRLPAQRASLAKRVQGFGEAFTKLAAAAELRSALGTVTSERDKARKDFNHVRQEYDALNIVYNKEISDMKQLVEERKRREDLEQQNAVLEAKRSYEINELELLRESSKRQAELEQQNVILETARARDREDIVALREALNDQAALERKSAILEALRIKDTEELTVLRDTLKDQAALEQKTAVLEAIRLKETEELIVLRKELKQQATLEQKNAVLKAARVRASQELATLRKTLKQQATVAQQNAVLEAARLNDAEKLATLREELERQATVEQQNAVLEAARLKDSEELATLREELERQAAVEQHSAALEVARREDAEELATLRAELERQATVEQHNAVLEAARFNDAEKLATLREELERQATVGQQNAVLEAARANQTAEIAGLREELERQITVERQNAVLKMARRNDSEELATLRKELQNQATVERQNAILEAVLLKHSEELAKLREELQHQAAIERQNAVLEAARLKDSLELAALRAALERMESFEQKTEELEAERFQSYSELAALRKDNAAAERRNAQLLDEQLTDRNEVCSLHDHLVLQKNELARKDADLMAVSQELADSLHAHDITTQALEARTKKLENSLESERQLEAKADYLFGILDRVYLKLLAYRKKPVARLSAMVEMLYKVITLRPRSETDYECILHEASEHIRAYKAPSSLAGRSRAGLAFTIMSYLVRNPASSMRSASWSRFKRALSVFFGTSRGDLEVWIQQRFPSIDGSVLPEVKPDLEPELDSLELSFPQPDQPRVSIILPAYNKYRMTVFCLRSLLEKTTGVDYEVILADDSSTDLTCTIGERIKGIEIVRAEENQGFVNNCRNGASHARGEFQLFLNNDTAFTDGWLSSLVAAMDADPRAGIVGPMLLFGNGRLQEAGGIIWDDASGWNFGRTDDPAKPEYNYIKQADYISGACLLIRRSLWEELGGFDQRYVPAYYEDTDLCFAVRAAGYKVLYQPASKIYHFEGISNGTDLNSGVKKHQVANKEKFLEKWTDTLQLENFPNAKQVFLARDRSRNRRTVLVIDHYVPHYDKDAGSRSTWQYLQLMVEMGYNVKFMGANFFPHQPYTQKLQAIGVEVLVGEKMARNFPTWLIDNAKSIDAVYLHRPHIAEQFVSQLHDMNPRPKLIYFGHDLHFLRVEREYEITGDHQFVELAEEWKQRELAVFKAFDKVYYPSQVEVDKIAEIAPDVDVSAIPLYVLEESKAQPYCWEDRSDILFVGGFNHSPNVDAICWFVEEILPLVLAECPKIKLNIVGSSTTDKVNALASRHVVIHGYLSDEELAEQYARARIIVVPLRFGAGVKGKVLEALQNGVPIVTTAIGAEGIPEPSSVFNITETVAGFAQEVIEIERGCSERLQKLDRYADYLDRHFSKARASEILSRDFGEPKIERDWF